MLRVFSFVTLIFVLQLCFCGVIYGHPNPGGTPDGFDGVKQIYLEHVHIHQAYVVNENTEGAENSLEKVIGNYPVDSTPIEDTTDTTDTSPPLVDSTPIEDTTEDDNTELSSVNVGISQPSSQVETQSEVSEVPQPSSVNEGEDDNTELSSVNVGISQPSSQVETQSEVVVFQEPLLITEYMLRDWSSFGRGDQPQWIEIYNPNSVPVSLNGYEFTYAYRKFVNTPWEYKPITLTELTIAPASAAILTNKKISRSSRIGGIQEKDVYVIPNDKKPIQLKNGWHLADAEGRLVHRIGTAFREYPADDSSNWDSTLGNPWLPNHTGKGYRVSHKVLPSEEPVEDHFYGTQWDVGSPGFYKPVAPAAPSLQRPKLITTWGALKKF